jgi:hypothetical protein
MTAIAGNKATGDQDNGRTVSSHGQTHHPGLWIDNCASGGRRIDLEACMRSVPLWRSDTSCSPNHANWDQVQTLGLSLYVPLFTACSWTTDAYVVRSGATAGAICQFDYLARRTIGTASRTGKPVQRGPLDRPSRRTGKSVCHVQRICLANNDRRSRVAPRPIVVRRRDQPLRLAERGAHPTRRRNP